MSDRKGPPAPPGDLELRGRGRKLWRAVLSDFELTPAETVLLHEACRQADLIDALAATVAEDGATVPGSRGQLVTHPALGELRQVRHELRRTLGALALPHADDLDTDAAPTSVADWRSWQARRAARSRWDRRGA